MALTYEDIRNQKRDLTPYTDEQVNFLVNVLNTIPFPWKPFNEGNIDLHVTEGALGEEFVLNIDNQCYMTTSAPDLLDHQSILQASGDILLTGFGLGLGVLYANANPNVKSATILEQNKDVIEHIAPMVLAKCTNKPINIIECDANTWNPDKQYNFGFIDHAYQRADDFIYKLCCTKYVNWWDERKILEEGWYKK